MKKMRESLRALSFKGAGFLIHCFHLFICSHVRKKRNILQAAIGTQRYITPFSELEVLRCEREMVLI